MEKKVTIKDLLLLMLTVVNIAMFAKTHSSYNKQEHKKKYDREILAEAYLDGAKGGAMGMCWRLTYIGNEKCDELVEQLK